MPALTVSASKCSRFHTFFFDAPDSLTLDKKKLFSFVFTSLKPHVKRRIYGFLLVTEKTLSFWMNRTEQRANVALLLKNVQTKQSGVFFFLAQNDTVETVVECHIHEIIVDPFDMLNVAVIIIAISV